MYIVVPVNSYSYSLHELFIWLSPEGLWAVWIVCNSSHWYLYLCVCVCCLRVKILQQQRGSSLGLKVPPRRIYGSCLRSDAAALHSCTPAQLPQLVVSKWSETLWNCCWFPCLCWPLGNNWLLDNCKEYSFNIYQDCHERLNIHLFTHRTHILQQ